jgi:hypothetical protein
VRAAFQARAEGHSWSEIGAALGVSRQGAEQWAKRATAARHL